MRKAAAMIVDSNTFSLLQILERGGAYSTRQFVEITKLADPRAKIRTLRKSGVNIKDFWVVSEGKRFKKYYLNK